MSLRPRALVVTALLLGPATARATSPVEAEEVARAGRALAEAHGSGEYGFCSRPRRPMLSRQAQLCPLSSEVDECEGYRKACDDLDTKEEPPAWLAWLAELLAPLARVLVWVVVAVAILAIAIPLAIALVRARRDRHVRGARAATSAAEVVALRGPPPPAELDAEAALRVADDHARRGEHARALPLYLAASLAALARRGAVRLAPHRTNGEYVRACTELAAKEELREIVREVDRVTYGRLPPTTDAVSEVAKRAAAIVRSAGAVVTTSLLAMSLLGCGALGSAADDPAGDRLPVDVLGRAGLRVERLGGSIASMPIPDDGVHAEVLLLDPERVTLEDESRARLLRWVESGGALVLLGSPSTWPDELGAEDAPTGDREVTVTSGGLSGGEVRGVRLARGAGLAWEGALVVARIGATAYAAGKPLRGGYVVGVASDDLLTNVGAARPANAAGLLALVEHAVRFAGGVEEGDETSLDEAERAMRDARASVTVRVARREDGIPPPSTPFSSLVRAGLSTFAWHALAAALVLFLAYGVRASRPRPEAPPARRAFTEHVEATGAFYGRARALPLALHVYGKFVESRLRERAPRGADVASFLAARAGAPLAEVTRVVERAFRASPDDEARGDELATIRALRDLYAKSLDGA